MRYWILWLACPLFLFASECDIERDIPSSVEQVKAVSSQALEDFDCQLQKFLSQALDQVDFNKTVAKWDAIVSALFAKGVIFSCLSLVTEDRELIQAGLVEGEKILKKLHLVMNDPRSFYPIFAFAKLAAKRPNLVTPLQRYMLYYVLAHRTSSLLQQEVLSCQKELSRQAMVPMAYQGGLGVEKSLGKNRKMTVLSWNVCFLENGLSWLFGGVRPWQERIDPALSKIKSLQPDVICLQEVFSEEASRTLIEQLKNEYAHFYYDMGPNPAAFSVEALGISSGLFVASKYPLKNARFVPFSKKETPSYRAYGFFYADISCEDRIIGRLLTTHLQPGYEEEDVLYRKAQLDTISSSIQRLLIPVFLCGDLNIEKKSKEDQLLKGYRQSDYRGGGWTCCELRDFWWKAQRQELVFSALYEKKEWLDYFLCWKKIKRKQPSISTDVLIVNDTQKPQKALSDHQILFTTIAFPK